MLAVLWEGTMAGRTRDFLLHGKGREWLQRTGWWRVCGRYVKYLAWEQCTCLLIFPLTISSCRQAIGSTAACVDFAPGQAVCRRGQRLGLHTKLPQVKVTVHVPAGKGLFWGTASVPAPEQLARVGCVRQQANTIWGNRHQSSQVHGAVLGACGWARSESDLVTLVWKGNTYVV